MLTTDGKAHIKRYLAGYNSSIGNAIALGIGSTPEVVGSTALQFEVVRLPVVLKSYDFASEQIVFKATMTEGLAASVWEAGLCVSEDLPSESKLLTTFDSISESWVNVTGGTPSTFSTADMRIGADALWHQPGASTTSAASLGGIELDLSKNMGSDLFSFAFYVANANISGLEFRFLSDASNYYSFTQGAQTTGYKIVKVAKSTAVATGSPNWANITEIQVRSTAGAGGAGSIKFDAIRVDVVEAFSLDDILVARKVLAVAKVFTEDIIHDIEFAVDVSV